MAYDRIVDSAYLESGLTEIAEAIRKKGETSASLTFPSGMAAAIEAIKAGGEGPISNAVLYVSYPADAVCTLSGNGKSYPALDSSGAAIFIVEPGTWTATAVLNGKTTSKSITLAAMERKELQLSFELSLIPNTDIVWTAKKTNSSYVTSDLTAPTVGTPRLQFETVAGSSSASSYALFYSTAIDITNYSSFTLHYMISSPGTGSAPSLRFGFGPDTDGDITSWIYYQKNVALSNTQGTYTVDISEMTGPQYFYVGWVKDSSKMTFYVDTIILS